jgi:mono/diheme cytochrome c family protein
VWFATVREENLPWTRYIGGSPLRGKILALLVSSLIAQPFIGEAQEQSEGRKLYLAYCTGCHGVSGKGDGPAGKTLTVKPADHTNTQKMGHYTDDHLFTVISKGGASVGRSAQMPAWGAVLKEAQIQEVIGYIRTLAAAKKDTAQVSGAK